MNIEELPKREYIINWFGIGSEKANTIMKRRYDND